MTVLLPSERTLAQRTALVNLCNRGELMLYEPCDCRGQVRHNNGGNYHEILSYRMDGGKCFVKRSSTSEYDYSEWEEIGFAAAVEEIAACSAKGYQAR